MMIKFAFDWPIATFKENYRVYVYELVVLMARKKGCVCGGGDVICVGGCVWAKRDQIVCSRAA